MIGVIISAHGKYASGLKSGIELVVGASENLKVVDFDGENLEQYRDNLDKEIISLLEKYGALAVATDIAGGTPYNTAVTLTHGDGRVKVLSGVNFQLAYELLNLNQLTEDDLLSTMSVAKDGIAYFAKEEDEDTSFEGGI